jgi:hypothetical protein
MHFAVEKPDADVRRDELIPHSIRGRRHATPPHAHEIRYRYSIIDT